MKKVVNANIGGRGFLTDEDAYNLIYRYLSDFQVALSSPEEQKGEIMEELEGRMAELFFAETGVGNRVVDIALARKVVAQLGMPDGSPVPDYSGEGVGEGAGEGAGEGTGAQRNAVGNGSDSAGETGSSAKAPHKFYRDTQDTKIAGVCSGIAIYFNVDVTLVRVLMLAALFAGSAGFWIYVILWAVAPEARTPAQKCELRGIPATAENMSKFSNERRK